MIDLYELNLFAMIAVILFIMVLIVIVRKQIGAPWVTVGFELLLMTILLRRIDDVAALYGIDLLDRPLSLALSWAAVLILLTSYWRIYQRRREIKRMEAHLRKHEQRLEELRHKSERWSSWDHQVVHKIE